jgi:hypothetical protein
MSLTAVGRLLAVAAAARSSTWDSYGHPEKSANVLGTGYSSLPVQMVICAVTGLPDNG